MSEGEGGWWSREWGEVGRGGGGWWCGGGGRRRALISTWKRLDLIVSASSPSLLSRNFLRSWSRYSKTRVSFFSVWITSCSLPNE